MAPALQASGPLRARKCRRDPKTSLLAAGTPAHPTAARTPSPISSLLCAGVLPCHAASPAPALTPCRAAETLSLNSVLGQALSPSPCVQVQFHAVALLHALRAGDRLAVSKLVASLTKGSGLGASSVRSPLAQCLLVRYVAQVRHRLAHHSHRDPAVKVGHVVQGLFTLSRGFQWDGRKVEPRTCAGHGFLQSASWASLAA